jgi:hypothetical protein
MQGQNATRAVAIGRCKLMGERAAVTPAIKAATSGWTKVLLLKPDTQRRTSAPRAALVAINMRLVVSSAPKMTPSDTAPMAANDAKYSADVGGKLPANNNAGLASSAHSFPSHSRSTTFVMASTLFMSTPRGFAGTISDRDVPSSSTVSLSQSGSTRARTPRARPRRSAVTTIRSVVCP